MAITSNIQKGGALLDDSRRLVEVWNSDESTEANLERITNENLLGKVSRVRTADMLRRILRPRLVDPGPHVIESLRGLTDQPRAFAEACYYEASRDDDLLAAFAEGPLFSWHEAGRVVVQQEEIVEWLRSQEQTGNAPAWSDAIQLRVARGLLAALRDFGVLTGHARKEIVPPNLSLTGFAYVAFRLHQQGASSRSLVHTHVWRRWLLTERRVAEMFADADSHGLLRFASAGTVVRVDWLVDSLPEAIRVAA